jgi:hypothetical protein
MGAEELEFLDTPGTADLRSECPRRAALNPKKISTLSGQLSESILDTAKNLKAFRRINQKTYDRRRR